MYQLFQNVRMIHIAAGTIALILFWIPIAVSKGGRLHVKVGWIYAGCMAVVVATALSLSGLAFAFPLAVRHFSRALSSAEAAQAIRDSRETAFFLAYLGGVTLAAGWHGIWAPLTRRNPEAMRTPFALGLNIAVILAAVGSLTMGIHTRSIIFASMSAVGFLVSGGNLVYLLRRPVSRMEWWYQHLGSMIGTGIAGYTAFLVFGGRHLLVPLVGGQYLVIFWILPTVIGAPAIALTTGYYQRKFRDVGPGAQRASSTQIKPSMGEQSKQL